MAAVSALNCGEWPPSVGHRRPSRPAQHHSQQNLPLASLCPTPLNRHLLQVRRGTAALDRAAAGGGAAGVGAAGGGAGALDGAAVGAVQSLHRLDAPLES